MKFTEILRELSVTYETEGRYTRAGWIQFRCPFCHGGQDPDKPYMGFNVRFAYCNCWRCGPHSVADTLVAISGMDAAKCKALLKDLDRVGGRREEVPRGRLILPTHVEPMLAAHRKYIRDQRKMDPDEIERLWSVQGTGRKSNLPWRLFIPIQQRSETVSWTTRAIGETALRYISAGPQEESVNHKHLIYGEDYCRHSIVLTEGPINVWRIGPGSGATMGVGYSREQLLRLSRYPQRAICFDNEPQAQKRANELCNLLEAFPGVTYNVCLDAKDPAEASDKEIRFLRKHFLE